MQRPPGLKTAINVAAEEAAAQAEELMEAVMKEAIRLLREELFAEIKEAKDSTQQLSASVKAQEELSKRVTRQCHSAKQLAEASQAELREATRQLAAGAKAREELCQRSAQEAKHTAEAEYTDTVNALKSLTSRCEQIQSDHVTRDDLERVKDQLGVQNSNLHRDLMKTLSNDIRELQDAHLTSVTKEHLEKAVSALHEEISYIKGECRTRATIEHVDKQAEQAQAIRTRSSSDQVSRADLDAIWEATLSQLRVHEEAAKGLTDKKVSEVNDRLSKIQEKCTAAVTLKMKGQMQELVERVASIKDNQEATLSEVRNHVAVTKDHIDAVKKQVSDLKREIRDGAGNDQMVQKREEQHSETKLSDSSTSSNFITRSDLEAIRESALLEMQGHAAAAKERVEEKIIELQSHLSQIKGESVRDQLSEIQDKMQEMQTHLSERKLQPDIVAHDDLEALALATLSELRKNEAATKEHVDKKISEVHEEMLKFQDQCLKHQLLEMKGQVQQMQAKLSECNAQPHGAASAGIEAVVELTKEQVREMRGQMQEMRTQLSVRNLDSAFMSCRDLDAFLEATLSELRGLGEATKDHVDKKISELRADSSEFKEQNVKNQVQEMRGRVREMQMELKERDAKSEFVTRGDLEAVRESTLAELRGHGTATKEQVDEKISELHARFCEMKGNRLIDQLSELKGLVQDMQKELSMRRATSNEGNEVGMQTVTDRIVEQVVKLTGQMQEVRAKLLANNMELDVTSPRDLESITHAAIALSDVKGHQAQRIQVSDGVSKADLEAVRDNLQGQVSYLQEDVHEIRRLSHDFGPINSPRETTCESLNWDYRRQVRVESNDAPSCTPCSAQWFSLSRGEDVVSL